MITTAGVVFAVCLVGVSAVFDATNFPSATATPEQPAHMAAWPKNGNKPGPCWKVTVKRDHAAGWPGQCLDLTKYTPSSSDVTVTAEVCQQQCVADPECSVWQFVDAGCFKGQGTKCYGRDGSSVNVTGAQRFQRGDVTVLKNMKDTWVFGLKNLGTFSAGDAAIGADRCRDWCYSDLNCEYWQYGKDGCWVETVGNLASNPLIAGTSFSASEGAVSASVTGSGNEARTIDKAEYIQHTCPPAPNGDNTPRIQTGQIAATPAPAADGGNTALYVGLAFLGLLALAIAMFCCMGSQKRKSTTRAVKKTRAVKAAPMPEPPVAETETVPLVPLMAPATTVTTAVPMYQQAIPVVQQQVVQQQYTTQYAPLQSMQYAVAPQIAPQTFSYLS